MKWLTILICLFLCIPVQAYKDNETMVVQWENRIKHISEKEASKASKEMAVLYQNITKSYLKNKKDQKTYLQQYTLWKTKRNQWQKYMKKHAVQYQMDQLYDMPYDMEQIHNWNMIQNDIYRQYKKWKQKNDGCTKQMKKEKDWMNRLEKCQTMLFEKYHEKYRGLKKGGLFDPEKSIQGYENIPAYGSVKGLIETHEKACPILDSGRIDTFSNGWISIAPNARISAGTWAYPRRWHAFGSGCSCSFIQ